MSETTVIYAVATPPPPQRDILPAEFVVIRRADLEELERRLIPLLVVAQRALGKEPTVTTRAERRNRE